MSPNESYPTSDFDSFFVFKFCVLQVDCRCLENGSSFLLNRAQFLIGGKTERYFVS